jgi:8-oxo-dGTP pyrophosphatase MutT (NUDIX family)
MILPPELTLPEIRTSFATHSPRLLHPGKRGQAAVAMVLHTTPATTDVLLIVRARHDKDPWSGNIGFPGGRLESGREEPRQAAEREALEELGLTLNTAEFLGQLDDLYGASLPVQVSCFVYSLLQKPSLLLNHEVANAFWYPLPLLLSAEHQQRQTFVFRGVETNQPVVPLQEPKAPLLWGITYRLLANFFFLCGQPFPQAESNRARDLPAK